MNKFGLHTFGLPSFGVSDFRLTSFGGDGDGGRKAALPSPDLYYDLSLKNNEHPTRNIIDDMSGNGRHATIYNAMYAKGSGYGKYAEDFMSRFGQGSTNLVTIKEKTTSSITISKLTKGRGVFEFAIEGQWGTYNFKGYSIKVEGYPPNLGRIEFYSLANGVDEYHKVNITGDGIYTLNDHVYQQPNEESIFYHGFVFNTAADVDCNLTITQIPEYEGAFVFDGIDDYARIDNITKGFKTLFMEVVPMAPLGSIFYDQRMTFDSYNFAIYNEPKSIAYKSRNDGDTYINGQLNTSTISDELIGKRQVVTIVNKNASACEKITFANGHLNSMYASNMALYKVIGFYDELTPAQIQKVITKYKLKYEQI